jgi:radical SAM-linked protein
LDTLLDLTEASLATTGYEDLSLLSLSTSDYGSIVPLMEQLMARCEAQRIAVSFPSLRAGTLTPELMKLIKKVRKTGFTIAPEAGSQRLRDVINKNITTQNIKDTVSHAFNLGWQVIKLYFMIGLPTETEADLQAIVALVKDLRRIKNQAGPKRRKGKINVSVTSFIPKPHTPFQWAPQISLSDSKEKIEWLQNQLRMSGVHFKWQKPEVSQIEGIWSRGDRRLSRLLVAAYQKGCRFDGWTDQFHYHAWQSAISDIALDIDFYTSRTRNMSEPMPWDIIDARVTRDYLREEWEKAVGGELTSDCRQGDCNACGVCDFEIIEPKVTVPDRENNVKMPSFRVQENQDSFYQKIKVSYSKLGPAKYFGHLELVKIFIRAIRRAGIPVKFSEGFHPKPKISFDDPLPIGMESLNETLIMTVPGQVRPIDIISDLNKHLPEGIVVQSCRLAPLKSARNSPDSADYQVSLKAGSFDQNKLEHYLKTPERIIARSNRKGKLKKINLKDIILKIKLLHPNQLYMKLKLEPGKTIRPNEVIRNIFNLSEEDVKKVRVLKGVAD